MGTGRASGAERFVPTRGWAQVAYHFTQEIRSRTRMKAATVAFCDNPFGGIGCSRKSTQSIFLSGGKLNGVPDVLDEPDEMLTSSPELLAVLAHELGHLYGDVHAHQQVVSSIDHPKVENAYLILLEFQADAAGLYNLFHQTKYSFGEVLAFAALAAAQLSSWREPVDDDDVCFLAEGATLLSVRVAMAKAMNPGVDIPPVLTQTLQSYRRILGDLAVMKFSLIGQRVYQRSFNAHELGVLALEDLDLACVQEWLDVYDYLKDRMDFKDEMRRQLSDDESFQRRPAPNSSTCATSRAAASQRAREGEVGTQAGGSAHPHVSLRPATQEEFLARRSLAESLSHWYVPEANREKVWSATPPGRLHGGRALRRYALSHIDKSIADTVLPFKRPLRKQEQRNSLDCGIIVDQSGSMHSVADQVAGAGWIVAHAVKEVNGEFVLVGMGDTGYVISDSTTLQETEVATTPSTGRWENVHEALQILRRRLKIGTRTDAVSLVVVVSDFRLGNEGLPRMRNFLARHHRNGGISLAVCVGEAIDKAQSVHATQLVVSATGEDIGQVIVDGVHDLYLAAVSRPEAV